MCKTITRYRFILLLFLMASCSSERNNPISRAWHDTCLRYNKYYLANEKMKEIEVNIQKAQKDDYNKILKIYPDCDSNMGKSQKANIDECMKKAAIGIDWHKNSRWIDNSFILIGKARMYENDFKNSKETFKLVNSKSKNENDKNEALIWLMNTYLRVGEYDNAAEVESHLEKQKLNNKNAREYYLTKSQFHYIKGEYPEVAKYVQKAIPLIPFHWKREKKARLHFIVGQIYQMYSKDSSALLNYTKCLKNNPTYELGFFAKLYSAQVTSVQDKANVNQINKYFKKLLKDPKNKEYKDKIYYEMAFFELKQDNVAKSIEYLNNSLKAGENPTQKGYSYLKMAEIYYEKTQEYEKSKYYYDSTLATLPKDHPRYKQISLRKNVLDEFVGYMKVVVLEDSLQRLSRMDSNQLNSVLNKIADKDFQKQKDDFDKSIIELKKAKELEKKKSDYVGLNQTQAATNTLDPNSKWYFYNTDLMAVGKDQFRQRWGSRVLEDDWRRSNKENADVIDNSTFNSTDTKNDSTVLTKDKEKEDKDKLPEFKGKRMNTKLLKDKLPFSDSAYSSSVLRWDEASFKLGKLFNFKLEEPQNAILYFNKILVKDPVYVRVPEIHYLLYLIYRNQKNTVASESNKNILLTNYPNSEFAKMIINPNWRSENKKDEIAINLLYKKAFQYYSDELYAASDSMLIILSKQFPQNNIQDKADLLRVKIKASTEGREAYKTALVEFMLKYPQSDLQPKARDMLHVCENTPIYGASNSITSDTVVPTQETQQILPEKIDNKTIVPVDLSNPIKNNGKDGGQNK